jgi:hypothetical protein
MQHTKLKRLVRALKVPQYAAVGILESLWHLTAREAPEGNIGKLSNEDIAAWMDWEGDPDQLITGLVSSGWIDEVTGSRLLIHDWYEHADDATKLAIKRKKATVSEFVPQIPTLSDKTPLPLPEPEPEPMPVPVTAIAHVISPDMIARGVMTELGLGGRELVNVLEEVCRSQVKLYDSPGALRDSMVESWRQYDSAKPSLAYTKGAAKFFGDGDWRSASGWPWKEGKQPAVLQPKTLTLIEKMRQQEAM